MADPPDLADLIHNFKNHLAIVVGFSELVLSELPADSPHRKDLEEIRKAGQGALALLPSLSSRR